GFGTGGALRDHAREDAEIEIRRPARSALEVTEPSTVLPDNEAQGVAITVRVHAHQLLGVSRGGSLFPQRLAGARPVDAPALRHRLRQRLARAPDEAQGMFLLVAHDGGPDL